MMHLLEQKALEGLNELDKFFFSKLLSYVKQRILVQLKVTYSIMGRHLEKKLVVFLYPSSHKAVKPALRCQSMLLKFNQNELIAIQF